MTDVVFFVLFVVMAVAVAVLAWRMRHKARRDWSFAWQEIIFCYTVFFGGFAVLALYAVKAFNEIGKVY